MITAIGIKVTNKKVRTSFLVKDMKQKKRRQAATPGHFLMSHFSGPKTTGHNLEGVFLEALPASCSNLTE